MPAVGCNDFKDYWSARGTKCVFFTGMGQKFMPADIRAGIKTDGLRATEVKVNSASNRGFSAAKRLIKAYLQSVEDIEGIRVDYLQVPKRVSWKGC